MRRPGDVLGRFAVVAMTLAAAGCSALWGFQDLTGPEDDGGTVEGGDDLPEPFQDAASGRHDGGAVLDAGADDGAKPEAGSKLDGGLGTEGATGREGGVTRDGAPEPEGGAAPEGGVGTEGGTASEGGTCHPNCCGVTCGNDDGCGATCLVGVCGQGLSCSAGKCVAPPDAGETLLVGGETTNGYLGDAWTWDPARGWSSVPGGGPSVGTLSAAAMASLDGHPVLFGGVDDSGEAVPDTWTFDGTGWTQDTGTGPSARSQAAMVTLNGSSIVLFGGIDQSSAVLGDTWQYGSGGWNPTSAGDSDAGGNDPVPRVGMGMAALASEIVLFGGDSKADGTGILGDTWVFGGATWTQLHPATSPPARGYHTMATLAGRVILFGGYSAGGSYLNDTWAFDGSNWTPIEAVGPSRRMDHAMDTLGDRVLLFGGSASDGPLGDTWLFDGSCWTSVKTGASGTSPEPRWFATMTGP